MKKTPIKLITALGLVAILSLQVIWLFHTYTLVRDAIQKDSDLLLDDAMNLEAALRAEVLPEGTTIKGAPMRESSEPNIAYLEEGLFKLGIDISLERLDSIYAERLNEQDITSVFAIHKVDSVGNVLESTQEARFSPFGTLKTSIIPIRIDKSLGIQAVLINPQWVIFERMGLLMLATLLMMVFVGSCIVYQIKIINKQNKIAKLREDFSYAMIHDMKSPLTSILLGNRTLRSGKIDHKPEKKENHFQIIEDETMHLLALTNKVLTISKIETGKIQLNKRNVLLQPMIDNLKEKFLAKATKPIEITTQLNVPSVFADEEYFYQVLSNLIDNAIKYSKESVRIEISSEGEGFNTIIRVKDDGIGISPRDQKIIFEKFERASAINRIREGGAAGFGLGLNYILHTVELHGGRVLVESVEDEYSEFILYMPQIINKL